MADVESIGAFGERRESSVSGLSDAIAKGAELGSNFRYKRAYAEYLKDKKERDVLTGQLQVQKLKQQAAKMESDQEKMESKNVGKILEDLSFHYAKDKSGLANFWTSDTGVALKKRIKKAAPHLVTEAGDVLLPDTQETIKSRLELQRETYLNKLASGEQLKPGEAAFLENFKGAKSTDLFSKAYAMAIRDPEFSAMDGEEKKTYMQNAIKMLGELEGGGQQQSSQEDEDVSSFIQSVVRR